MSSSAGCVGILIVGGLVGLGSLTLFARWPWVSLTSDSPDGRFRVQIVEQGGIGDRRFHVDLMDRRSDTIMTVYHSPDEGAVRGETITWDTTNRFALMVGSGLVTDQTLLTFHGDRVYLLIDGMTGDVWTASRQNARYPVLTCQNLRRLIFPDLGMIGCE